jgi:hypothetical protein
MVNGWLHRLHPECRRAHDHIANGIDEEGRPDSCLSQLFDRSSDTPPHLRIRKIEPTLGRDLLTLLRNEGDLHRTEFTGDPDHLPVRRGLEVYPTPRTLHEAPNVAVLDVPTILPEMHSNPVRAA